MSVSLYIDGTDSTTSVEHESFQMAQEASFKNSELRFRMKNLSTLPSEGSLVEFYENSTLKFSGKMGSTATDSPLPEKRSEVLVQDWYQELMNELVRTTYTEQTLEDIIQDIIAQRVLDKNLKALLQFEEGTGTTAYDSGRFDQDAALTGAGVTWDTVNYAIDMTGAAGSYVSIPDGAQVDLQGSISLCIDLTLSALNATIVKKENGAGDPPYALTIDSNGYLTFAVASGGSPYSIAMTSGGLSTGTRYRITAVFDLTAGTGVIYVNGVAVKTGSLIATALGTSSGALVIGASSGASLNAKVYRFALYAKALSSLEARRWHLDILEVKAPRRLLALPDAEFDTAPFPYQYPADCFTWLANQLGMGWRIDETMFVRMVELASASPTATISETDGDSFIQGTMSVEKDISQLRNVVIVRGGLYGASWQQDTLKANGSDTVFSLPYRYESFEVFTDTASLCADIRSFYKMEEGSGNLADEKTANTLVGANLTYSATGKIGNAITFNGATSVARKTSASHATGDAAHSIVSWIKPTTFDTTQRIIAGFGDFSSGHSKLSLIVSGGIYYLRHEFGGGITTNVSIGDISAAFHLVGLSYDPSASAGRTVKLYLDGVLKSTTVISGTPNIASGVMEIGGNNGSNVFAGDIDETSFYNYSLSDQEQEAIYNLGNTSGIFGMLLRSGVEFLNLSGFDAYYNYSEKNYRFTTAPANNILLYPTGNPKIPIIATRSSDSSITDYGRREFEINDEKIESMITARDLAAAELSKRKDGETRISFKTYLSGITPGVTLLLVLPSFGITSGNYFVQRVDTEAFLPTASGNILHLYTVECSNALSKDWIDYLRDAFTAKKKPIDPTEEQAIGDIIDFGEDITVADVFTFPTPLSQTEVVAAADAHSLAEVASGNYKWSNDGGTTPDKLRWNLGDWG